MGKKYSPGEKRLRGLLSGDPKRVARTLSRTVWTNDPEIYTTIAKSKDVIIAAIGDMVLPDDDARDRRDKLFARFAGTLAGGAVECTCSTTGPSGNPKSSRHYKVTQENIFAGHCEMSVQCEKCGRNFRVKEDLGYHFPQYSWR